MADLYTLIVILFLFICSPVVWLLSPTVQKHTCFNCLVPLNRLECENERCKHSIYPIDEAKRKEKSSECMEDLQPVRVIRGFSLKATSHAPIRTKLVSFYYD